MNLQIGDIMTKNVLVAQQHYSFTQVCRLFFAMKIHHLPIVDDRGALVGILSTNDVLNIYSFRAPMLPSLSEDSLNAAFSIGEIMTKNPKTIGPQAGLAEAARLQRGHLDCPHADEGRDEEVTRPDVVQETRHAGTLAAGVGDRVSHYTSGQATGRPSTWG